MAELASTALFSDAALQAYWKLENTNDSKNSNNLTNVNTVTFPSGKYNNGANLVLSSSQCLTAPDSASLSVTGAISISAWVKYATTPTSGNRYIIAAKWDNEGTGLSSRSYAIFLFNNAGTLMIEWDTSSNGGNSGVKLGQWNWTPTTGLWYHIVITEDTSGNAILYINNVSQGTKTAQNTAISDQAQKLWIGAWGDGSGGNTSFHDGMIDDVGLFSKALSSAEVSTLFTDMLVSQFLGLQQQPINYNSLIVV